MKPLTVLRDRRCDECCVESAGDFMGRGKIDRVGRYACRRFSVLLDSVCHFAVERGTVHAHPRLEKIYGTGAFDEYLRMPDRGHVTHDAPNEKRQQKR